MLYFILGVSITLAIAIAIGCSIAPDRKRPIPLLLALIGVVVFALFVGWAFSTAMRNLYGL